MDNNQEELKQTFDNHVSKFNTRITDLLSRTPISCTKKIFSNTFDGLNPGNKTVDCSAEMKQFFEQARELSQNFKNSDNLLETELKQIKELDEQRESTLSLFEKKYTQQKKTEKEETYNLSYVAKKDKEEYPEFNFGYVKYFNNNEKYRCIGKSMSLDGIGARCKLCTIDKDKLMIEKVGSMIVFTTAERVDIIFDQKMPNARI